MDQNNRAVPDLFGTIRSWFPWRPEPANVSRDFWMPDRSCRVCYECDSEFTIFNRRHHCRLCGRIFCARCTSNSIPAPSDDLIQTREDWDRIRVCNYCFKQWEQGGVATTSDHLANDADSNPSCSPSKDSIGSSASSRSAYCSTVTLNSMSFALGRSEQMSQTSSLSPYQSAIMDPYQSGVINSSLDGRGEEDSASSSNSGADVEDQSSNQFENYTNRFEYEDDGYSYQLASNTCPDEYYDRDEHGAYRSSQSTRLNEEYPDKNSFSSPVLQDGYDSHGSHNVQDVKVDHDLIDECEASSSLCAAEDVEMEPVDFENNKELWLPPQPENEEDEKDAILLDDDDEGDAAGEFGFFRTSDSFGSGDYCGRDNFPEDHKKAMKNVVDGHFRALVSQLLQAESIPMAEEGDSENWLDIITYLSWEAATILKPDMSRCGGMDPGGYVKVKCLASGRRSESSVVKGVVCKKNVAHRRMTKQIEKPRLMILGGALEYQRVSNLLSSVDTLLKQEMDHLKMAVAKIDAHNPNLLLVEKSVSRFAQDYILEKDISLVLNIKRPLLERIARCTGAQIVPSVDHLSSQMIGHCDSFHVERCVEEHGSAGQGGRKLSKTLMFFEGCPKPLGCTILLRGSCGDELKKVKAVVQYGVFAAYHLALETSFLADEGASLPELSPKEPITVPLPNHPHITGRSISTVPVLTPSSIDITNAIGDSHYSDGVLAPKTLSLSGDSCLQNLALEKAGSSSPAADCLQGDSISTLTSSLSSKRLEENPFSIGLQKDILSIDSSSDNKGTVDASEESKSAANKGDTVAFENYDTVHGCEPPRVDIDKPAFGSAVTTENISGLGELMDGMPLTLQLDAKNYQNDLGFSTEEFPPPTDNQSILVSMSSRCIEKGTICERSHLCRIKYYGSCDKPLGRVLQDHLFDENYRCQFCDMSSDAHVQCYTHRQGTLTISVKKIPEILLPGDREGKIWMWHRCLKCQRFGNIPPATRRVVMSDAAWGLSFGKFLELSFSNHAAASRVASCGHSLHRDCLRFYGSGKMVACFRYASIDVHSVFLPPSKLDFNYEIQDWIKKETNEVVDRAEVLFSEVLNALTQVVENRSGGGSVKGGVPDTRLHYVELEEVLQKEKADFEEILQKTLNKEEVKKGQPVIDILEINHLRRQLLFQSFIWDYRLLYASGSEKSNFLGMVASFSEAGDKAAGAQDASGTNIPSPSRSSESVDPHLVHSSKSRNGSPIKDQEMNSCANEPKAVKDSEHLRDELVINVDCHEKNGTTATLDSGAPVRRALSDSHFSFFTNLSDTLDAAWTGESQPVAATPKEGNFHLPGSISVDSSLAAMAEKFAMEREGEDVTGSVKTPPTPSPAFSTNTKKFVNVEDGTSWLRVPFLNFYRSLNRNFFGSPQRLDSVGGYKPLYVSTFRELEIRSGARLLLPVGVNETVIPVFDDEPTSIISYALASQDYHTQLCDEGARPKEMLESTFSLPLHDSLMFQSFQSGEDSMLKSFGSLDESMLSMPGSHASDPLLYSKSLHARVSFSDNGPLDKAKYTVTCYYAKQFDALRKICCPSELDFVRSLSRCKKWGAQGGKSNVFFAKTLDDRFIIKQVTKTELESFIKFAPEYFNYLTEAISRKSPTCLAKILGIYQVVTKNLKGGKETKMDVLVMENLLFGRKVTKVYDLKGSTRSRYNPDANGSNKVLLDQNLIEAMPTSPIFVGNKAKRLLERAVWNDTSFLASVDVMDYSLLVGVDEGNHELVLGIIDFMRQYTWDKHLESWVKTTGILGGSKNSSPTVISPKQYKKRFRKAMTAYFLMVPDQWSHPIIPHTLSQGDDNSPQAHD